MKTKPTADEVREMRETANLTQAACAAEFGYLLRSWQKKEDAGPGGRGLTVGEWQYLQLLAGQHLEFELKKRPTPR